MNESCWGPNMSAPSRQSRQSAGLLVIGVRVATLVSYKQTANRFATCFKKKIVFLCLFVLFTKPSQTHFSVRNIFHRFKSLIDQVILHLESLLVPWMCLNRLYQGYDLQWLTFYIIFLYVHAQLNSRWWWSERKPEVPHHQWGTDRNLPVDKQMEAVWDLSLSLTWSFPRMRQCL